MAVLRATVLGSLLGAALASTDCSSKSLNVTSQSDLDGISSCSQFSGDIVVTGEPAVLTLNGVESVGGDIVIFNLSTLTSFSAPTLQSINGTLNLTQLTQLNTLSFPQLTDVSSLYLQTAPALEELQFNAGIQNSDSVIISDTSLQSLDGLNLSQVDVFNINNNKYIDVILSGVTSVTDSLDISFNSNKVNVSLPYLKWANNATFQFCSSVSLPSLEKVNQSIGFINNSLPGLQLDNVTEIGASLAIVANSNLSNASFNGLSSLGGGFQIANNTNLLHILGFPKLEKVGGAISFYGNFSQAALPSLEEVSGGVVINSTNTFNCSSFDKAHSAGDFHGDKYVCAGKSVSKSYSLSATSSASTDSASGSSKASATATSSGSASGSSSSSSSSSKSKNGAATASTGIASTLAMLLFSIL